jgi:hypothetical protein
MLRQHKPIKGLVVRLVETCGLLCFFVYWRGQEVKSLIVVKSSENRVFDKKIRRGGDSNPRYSYEHTGFRNPKKPTQRHRSQGLVGGLVGNSDFALVSNE